MKGQRAVVLLSGGLDSATVLAVARAEGFECHALTVDHGQRHSGELKAAKRVAAELRAASHRVVGIDLRAIGGSALTDDIAVPKEGLGEGIPVTYVPARNTVFLAVALGLAEVVGATHVFVGISSVDYSGYPDCRPGYVEAFQRLADLATKSGVEGKPIRLRAPLLHLSKAETVRTGLGLGVDYAWTTSCYDPDTAGRACGECDSCRIRAAAFAELGLPDPALAP
jgi:7-cyano-7-deazaguanine synthase